MTRSPPGDPVPSVCDTGGQGAAFGAGGHGLAARGAVLAAGTASSALALHAQSQGVGDVWVPWESSLQMLSLLDKMSSEVR